MLHIVTGTQRSGTSMMMKCLIDGGMNAYFDQAKEDELRLKHPDTNEGGYYEPSLNDMKRFDFPLFVKGNLIKFHSPWLMLGNLCPHKYKILLITRDPREIVLSLSKFNNGLITTGDLNIFNNYHKYIDKAVSIAKNRRDVISLRVVNYDDILASPLAFFSSLDWPIDPAKAAAGVNAKARKTPKINKPFSGDIATDLGMAPPIGIREAILDGKIQVPPDYLEAAKNGAEFGLSAS